MTVWIVTTGSSDVVLKDCANSRWSGFRNQVNNLDEFQQCPDFNSLPRDSKKKISVVPVRALGLVYSSHEDNFATDLQFPLLDVLVPELQSQISQQPDEDRFPLRVIVLITDQRQLFQERKDGINDPDCPFWQDTYELRPILHWYFQKSLKVEPEFITLEPYDKRGIDHWDAMLTEVKNKLSRFNSPENEIVYVSHQAGTPAISSAVQFTTISKFNQVKFLVSNQFDQGCQQISYEAETILSSKYWRSLQIQKAKKLIEKRLPSAALELLDGIDGIETIVTSERQSVISELKRLVSVFNLKEIDDSNLEFEPKNAIKRVRKALDLIEIFFEQENYIQGITLLAAAQESFLKASIREHLNRNITDKIGPSRVSELVFWDKKGLCLRSVNEIKNLTKITGILDVNSLITQLKLPEQVEKNQLKANINTHCSKKPHKWFELSLDIIFVWLQKLTGTQITGYWHLIRWSCKYQREYDYDRRNQLMHNLRGVEKIDVIHYLLGCPTDENNLNLDAKHIYQPYEAKKAMLEVEDVMYVYSTHVKKPFLDTLKRLNLWDDEAQKYKPLQTELEELANYLQ